MTDLERLLEWIGGRRDDRPTYLGSGAVAGLLVLLFLTLVVGFGVGLLFDDLLDVLEELSLTG